MLIVPCTSWPTGISFSGRKMETPFISFNVSFIILTIYYIYIENKNNASNNSKDLLGD
jgi:hypothetical protein